MSETLTPIPLERLLAHRDWVRAVARSVAYDEHAADDIEQETWLEAMRAPPRDDRNLRGWLGAVARNRARKRGRSASRRANHETAVPPGAPPPAPDHLVAEAEAQQRVVAAVLELDEPYRTTVLLRFYESLPPRDVAARMDVPVETVRTRVRRAVERLRVSLGGGRDDRATWMAAIAPLLPAAAAVPPVPIASTAAIVTGATVAAALIGAAVGLVVIEDGPPPPAIPAPVEIATAAPASEPPTGPPLRLRVRPPSPQPAVVPEPPPAPQKAPPAIEVPAPDAAPSDEPESCAKVRAKYAGDEGGFPFWDLRYWIDAEELGDTRWSQKTVVDPDPTRGTQLIAEWANPAGAEGSPTIRVEVVKLAHEQREGSVTTPLNLSFDNLGKQVPCSDADGLLEAFYEDWKRGASDVVEDECAPPQKSRVSKIARRVAVAVGTVPTTKSDAAAVKEPATEHVTEPTATSQRVRKEWHVWSDDKEAATYVVTITYSPAVPPRDRLVKTAIDFMRALRQIKDKVRWDE